MSRRTIAMYGLGVMGSSLAKNLFSRGHRVLAYSKSADERDRFEVSCPGCAVYTSVEYMLQSMSRPRVLFLMITAGAPVDQVLSEVAPSLSEGDVVIDGGNSHYADTERRYAQLRASGIHYIGLGVSGGEQGALNGPSMMAGGSKEGWEICGEVLQSAAAIADKQPCCDFLGAGGVGHYVKMVHNGIEYAMLQLIAEVYLILKDGLKMPHEDIVKSFRAWNRGVLQSYLIGIACDVLSAYDGKIPLVEKILDEAGQKGTGGWTLLDAVDKKVYAPTISEAVLMRSFSAKREMRMLGSKILVASTTQMELNAAKNKLRKSLIVGFVVSYAQGIELMGAASDMHNWALDIPLAVSLWRSGCIIRSRMLPDVIKASSEPVPNIILGNRLSYVTRLESSLREVVVKAMAAGLAVPALTSVLTYYDCMRAGQMPMNIVQGMRDCFGAHTYRRIDKPGDFHTDWLL